MQRDPSGEFALELQQRRAAPWDHVPNPYRAFVLTCSPGLT